MQTIIVGNDVQWTQIESRSVRQSVCAKLARDKLTHCKILCRTFDDSCCCTFVNKNFVIPLSIIQLSIEDDPKMQNMFSDEIVGRYSFRLCCCCWWAPLRTTELDSTDSTLRYPRKKIQIWECPGGIIIKLMTKSEP